MLEEVLSGGHMNHVVRVGDTVRRAAGAWTPTVQRLLRHARARGVGWVPEPFGVDELGREILSFVPGEVPHAMPDWVWSEVVLTDIARALREWHDATVDFDTTGAVWGLEPHQPHEVICHDDFAPYNCVFRDGRFAGAIDFDLCAPGPRLWDLAYTTYRFVPLMPPPDADVPDGARERAPFDIATMLARLDRFLAVYAAGNPSLRYDRPVLIASVVERLGAIAAWTTEHVRRTGQPALAEHAAMYRAHARWLQEHLAAAWAPGGP